MGGTSPGDLSFFGGGELNIKRKRFLKRGVPLNEKKLQKKKTKKLQGGADRGGDRMSFVVGVCLGVAGGGPDGKNEGRSLGGRAPKKKAEKTSLPARKIASLARRE